MKFTLDLNIHPPESTVAYQKAIYLAEILGVDSLCAEKFALDISNHFKKDNQSGNQVYCLNCSISNKSDACNISVHASDWLETVDFQCVADTKTIEKLRDVLPDMSPSSLLQQADYREQRLIQQRNQWQERASQLSLDMACSIQQQAMHDILTGLPNRRLFTERAEHLIQLAKRQQQHCCLILIGINQFKDINDDFGHQIGDLVLQEIGERLRKAVRTTDLLARLGGDEFALLLLNANATQSQQVVSKLQEQLNASYRCCGQRLGISESIGIAEFPEHGDDFYTLLRKADVAMYYAKQHNTQAVSYNAMQDKHSQERNHLLRDMQEAIETDGMELYYQPQVPMDDDERLSVEALIRWKHPKRGMVFPDQFIPLAEDSGLIMPLTWWVLETAVLQCARWHQAGLPVNVSINITADFLREENVVQRVADCVCQHQLPDHVLALEITENTLMDDPVQASKILVAINALKVDVSIDDFGTGYSSLAYLKHLEIDELKIDRSFIVGMSEFKNDAVIVKSVINMAQNMGLRVVAEGVETRAEWDQLAEMGCDFIQGYYISRPQPESKITPWLENIAQHGVILP